MNGAAASLSGTCHAQFLSLPIILLLAALVLVIVVLLCSLAYYRHRLSSTRESLVRYICMYLSVKDYVPCDKRPVVCKMKDPVTPDEFIQIINRMLKRMMLLPLVVLPMLPLRAQSQNVEADSVYEFRFVPKKDVFYIPYKDNLPEMQRLSAFVEQYRQEIADGKMPLYVDGYCSSLSDASANLAVARVRSNQVKGELILHHGMREEYFITHNHAQGGDVVTVSITIPAEPAKEEVAQPTVQPQEEQTAAMTEQASQTSQSEPNREPNREERAVSVTTPTETETRDKSIEPKAQTCNSHISLRANLLHWATLTPDVGIEWQFARRWSVAVDGSWSSWSWNDKNRRYALWEVAPEVRYYLSESNKFYVGAQYKIGAFNYKLSATGKQGDLQGGGITLGYKLPLGKSLALDFNVGAGCLHTDYKTYQVIDGVRVKDGDHSKNAWGVTDLGVTLVWKLN